MSPELLIYLVSVCICVVGSWIAQYKKVSDAAVFGYLGFIPFFNVIIAGIFVFAAIIELIGLIVTLPSRLFRDSRRDKNV